MDYKQTLDKLYNMFPDFQQVGSDAYKPGLERIKGFTAQLGSPQDKFRIIHVAGTNGKGSVSHMLASILTSAGYRTGLYTSPHLRDFRERIRIDGEMISEQEVMDFASRNMEAMEGSGLSFFEATAAMAFSHFADNNVDFAVIETGLGGRLDATNIVIPLLSVITNIGLDHTAMLGNTLPAIAREKAGIIKQGIPTVIGERNTETEPVFREMAKDKSSELIFAQEVFRYAGSETSGCEDCQESGRAVYTVENLKNNTIHDYECDLCGIYQRRNIVTALAAADTLKNSSIEIPEGAIITGLSTASLSTGLSGRWQILSRSPLIVCDTGHNAHGIGQVVRQIASQRFRRLFMVIGVVEDKDLGSILPLLPKEAYYIFTSPSIRRALPADRLAQAATLHGLGGEVCPTVPQAVEKAMSLASPDDMIFIGGSTFVVAEIETL